MQLGESIGSWAMILAGIFSLFAIFGVNSFIVLTRIMSGVVVLVSIMLVLNIRQIKKKGWVQSNLRHCRIRTVSGIDGDFDGYFRSRSIDSIKVWRKPDNYKPSF